MTRITAFMDACVLVPVSLTDTLLRLADRDLFRPAVVPARVGGSHPASRARRNAPAGRCHEHDFPDALVPGWEPLVTGIALPGPDDRHVVAAAPAR